MGIIQCSEKCKYQTDGYCQLDKFSTVSTAKKECPYFIPISFNNGNSLSQTVNTYKL